MKIIIASFIVFDPDVEQLEKRIRVASQFGDLPLFQIKTKEASQDEMKMAEELGFLV